MLKQITQHHKNVKNVPDHKPNNLSRSKFGDGLGALRDGVLGELAGEDEAHRGLDLAGGDGGLLVVVGEAGGFLRELLEDVVDEGVHDGHGLGGDPDVRVHLLEHLEDVDLVGLDALLGFPFALLVAALLAGAGDALLRLRILLGHRLLLGGLLIGLWRHHGNERELSGKAADRGFVGWWGLQGFAASRCGVRGNVAAILYTRVTGGVIGGGGGGGGADP
jgi:hypothetical protein